MSKIIWSLLIFLALYSCKKETTDSPVDPVSGPQYELFIHPSWVREPLKSNYSIQFPPGYTGGLIQFEGSLFRKENAADSLLFHYFNSNGWYSPEFGDPLADVQQDSLEVVFQNGTTMLMDQRVEFVLNGSLTGILFHTNTPTATGRLFWKNSGVFSHALDLKFSLYRLPLAIQIIRTIKHN